MRYYLLLLIVAICEAGRITRGLDFNQLYNIRTVHHGHGATSYQNVQADNHDSIVVPTNYEDHAEFQDTEHYSHHSPFISILKSYNDINHADISNSAPYEEFTDVKSDVPEHYFNDDDEEKHNYDFHL